MKKGVTIFFKPIENYNANCVGDFFNMAAGDTALWLHNKLGSTDDLWSGKTICSQLSQDKLQNIHSCFHTLQPHVKVKLMLSFLHIPRRNVDLVRRFVNKFAEFKIVALKLLRSFS